MSRFAKVTSIDAVEKQVAALETFKEETTAALDSLELEVRRALDWILHDRKDFWQHEVRRGWERVAEARAELERKMTYHSMGDYQPACRDEKLALEKARRRLRAAEEKVEVVGHWARTIEQEVTEFRGAANQFAGWLQADLPQALAHLKHLAGALESYMAVKLPPESAAPKAASPHPTEGGGPTDRQTPPGPRTPEVGSDKTPSGSPAEPPLGSSGDEDLGPEHGCRESGRRDEDAPDSQIRRGGTLG